MAYAIANTANKRATWRRLKQDTNYTNNVPLDPHGLFAFDTGEVAVATTHIDNADDAYFTFQFPDDCYLVNLQVTTTELDTGADALVFDVVTSDTGASGGTEVVLINDTGIGQVGATDELDPNQGHFLRDVSGLYLGINIGVAANVAAAGTIRFKGLIHIGSPVTGF